MKSQIENNHNFAQTCPLLLKDEQFENPYLAIQAFFSYLTLGGYRAAIDTWFTATLHESLKHPNPETVIYLHQQIQTLLNACYLIATNLHQTQPILLRSTDNLWNQLLKENQANDNESPEAYAQPYWLELNHSENPILFFQEFLTIENIKHLRLGLQEWLEDGLSEHSCLADTNSAYGFTLYRQLHQILEASHLLILPKS